MSDKLFEYKDPQDWYIAQWGEDADYNKFSQVPAEASTLLDQLELLFAKDPEGFPLNLSVMRYGSAFRFLTFVPSYTVPDKRLPFLLPFYPAYKRHCFQFLPDEIL